MDKKTHNVIIQSLRKASLRWRVRNEVITESKVRVEEGRYKNGNQRYKVYFRCALCGELFNRKQIDVDHKDEVGQFVDYNTFVERLFCEKSNLQVLCKEGCHAKKTKVFNKNNAKKNKAKKKAKDVLDFL